MTDSEKITKAFKELRKKGWFARKSFWCCQSCGCAAVPNEYNNKFVFYHKQDADAIKTRRSRYYGRMSNVVAQVGDIMDRGMYMTHGEGGDGKEVVNALIAAGLNVEWDESNNTRILVMHNDKEGPGTYTKTNIELDISKSLV